MDARKGSLGLLAALALLPALARAGGPGAVRDLKATAVAVELDGASTLHPWKATALSASAAAELEDRGEGLAAALAKGGLKGLRLVVEAGSLKSTETSGMDKNMHNDLDAKDFPQITFTLKDYTLTGGSVVAHGDLRIHGQTKPVELAGTLAAQGKAVRVEGATDLLMSDYGVKPPVMMFGAVRVADQVKVRWGLTLGE